MDAKARTGILAEVQAEALIGWRQSIEAAGSIEMIHSPDRGLAMMRAQDSVGQEVFNVGEISITDASVSVDGVQGYGICMGRGNDKAYALALIDAVYRTGGSKWDGLIAEMNLWLSEEQRKQLEQKRQRHRLIRNTLVDFEVMDAD